MIKFSHAQTVTAKVLLLATLALVGLPYYFWAGGTILGFILVRVVARTFGVFAGIASHRWLCHNHFEPRPWARYMMLAGLVLSGYGRPVHIVIAHRLHHANSDREHDPHSPRDHSFWDLWLGRYKITGGVRLPRDFYRHRDLVFLNQHYWLIYWTINLVIALVDLKTALIFCPLTFLWGWTLHTVVNYQGHCDGDTIAPRNLGPVLTFLTLGEGLHKNHHDSPGSYHFERDGRWDPSRRLIEWVRQ